MNSRLRDQPTGSQARGALSDPGPRTAGRALGCFSLLLLLGLGTFVSCSDERRGAPREGPEEAPTESSKELQRLFEEDQRDRMVPDGSAIDWARVLPRDVEREKRVREMLKANQLVSGADYFHAAMVLQHGPRSEDYLLAHDLCIVALTLGEKRAGWLAAASEDRFFMSIRAPQRFGTQTESSTVGPGRLYPVGAAVTDAMRQVLGVQPLAERAMVRQPGRGR